MLTLEIILGILAAILVLFLVLLLRTCFYKPKKEKSEIAPAVKIDEDKALKDLQNLIRCKTVSNLNKTLEKEEEFTKLKATLKTNYPLVYEKTDFEELSSRELLFHLKGTGSDKKHAAIFMAHFDVVPANASQWKKPPFDGVIEKDVLWGRGTLDTKVTLNGTLCALEKLLEEGFLPVHDFYCAFAGDEEIAGGSAKLAVAYFKNKGIDPLFVLDEGGAVVENVFPGVEKPIAVIGTAEKGAFAGEFYCNGEGGHASAPKAHTPVGKLAEAVVYVEKHPTPFRLTAPVKEMFDTLGRETPFSYRFIFANVGFFKPLLSAITKKKGGQLNAVARTTTAFTMMKGSSASNVIPDEAMVGFNSRLLPGDTVIDATKRMNKVAKKFGLTFSTVNSYAWDASSISMTHGEGYDKISRAIKATWGSQTIVSPYLMTACADAHHYSGYSDKVYRFSASKMSAEQLGTIHGDNERITKKQNAETVEFYYRLMKSL